jgi:hypothetical protein
VELHVGCGAAAAQLHGATPCCVRSTKKAMATAVAFFFWLLWALLLLAALFQKIVLPSSSGCFGAMLQRNSTKKATAIALRILFFLCYCLWCSFLELTLVVISLGL